MQQLDENKQFQQIEGQPQALQMLQQYSQVCVQFEQQA